MAQAAPGFLSKCRPVTVYYNERDDAEARRGVDPGDPIVRVLPLIALAGALWLPSVADAREWGPGFRAALQAQGEHLKKGPGPQQHGERDKRGEHDKRHQSRLTEEQRRELHRDLDRANREIYRR